MVATTAWALPRVRHRSQPLRSLPNVRTDPRELHRTHLDLLVVGAGIHGAAIARDAALRGLQVGLVDARDVAAGTSSRSSRLVHGGLRYLRQGNFALVRDALHERERLLRLCPHLVRPQPMLMPFFGGDRTPRWLMRLGTFLYDRLAGRSTLPRPRPLHADAALAAFPGLRRRGLRSGLEFYDAATEDVRLTLANVLAAAAAGASVATHCAVVGAVGERVLLRDTVAGVEVEVSARHVINACGPRVDALRQRLGCGGAPLVRLSRGSHLVLPPRPGELALAAFLPDDRIQFVIPHRDGTLVGTTEVEAGLDGDETGPPATDLDYLHGALGHLFDAPPARDEVAFAYAGWRALPAQPGPAGTLHREGFLIAERWPGGELHTVVGGKLTTHRSFAERALDGIFGAPDAHPTRTVPLPGGDGPRDVGDALWWRHGSLAIGLHRRIAVAPELGERLCEHRPFLVVELVHAVEHQGAVTFADVMLRRLAHSQGPCLEPACLRRAHARFVTSCRWPVDADAARAIEALRDEVAVMVGELPSWRAAANG